MHIVFLSWWWPYPASNGSKIRIYNLLRGLAAQHRVTLLSFAEADEATLEQIAHLREFCVHVEAIPKPTYHPGALKATLGYFSRWPRSLVDVYSPLMADRIRTVAAQSKVDMVVASELQTLRYLDVLPDVPGVLEEIEVTIFHDRVAEATSRGGRMRAQLTLSKLQQALYGLLQRGIAFTVVSESEREKIRQFAPSGARIEVIPNGVDTRANQPDPAATPEPDTLIYPGAVTYFANLDAVTYCADDVLPRLRQSAPAARLRVTGDTGEVDVSRLKALPGVEFTGFLPSVADAIRRAQAVIVPLRVGGGTRLKILEAMALGTPVISTRKGAEGLNVTDGEDILLADTPDELAAAALWVFRDPALRARLAAAGRARVEREYDWQQIAAQLSALIVDTVRV